jgi:hypothetical protein
MKIKSIFANEKVNEETIYVSLDTNKYNGLLRANDTASFIIDSLSEDTTEEEIVSKTMTHYSISEELARRSVLYILSQLRQLNLLEES